ncbi:helix-turn-helix domain-containing protein [Blastococcus sp. SYSU DS0552]
MLTAFGDHIDNRSGEAWPSQKLLAEESGQGKRTVERAMKAAERLGWIEEIARPVPNVRGTKYRATVPDPDHRNSGDGRQSGGTSASGMVASQGMDGRQCKAGSSPGRLEMVAIGGEQTLTRNSHLKTLKEERRPPPGATGLPEVTGVSGEQGKKVEADRRQSLSEDAEERLRGVWEQVEKEAAKKAEVAFRNGELIHELNYEALVKYRPHLPLPPTQDEYEALRNKNEWTEGEVNLLIDRYNNDEVLLPNELDAIVSRVDTPPFDD